MKTIARSTTLFFLLCVSLLGCRLFIGMPKTGWEMVGARGFTGTAGLAPTLVSTPTGAVIAYADGPGQPYYSLMVKSWDGIGWSTLGAGALTTAMSPGGSNKGSLLALDSAGAPVIAWTEWTSGSPYLRIQKYVGGAWTSVANAALPSGSPQVTLLDMAIDPATDTPAVLVQVLTDTAYALAVYGPSDATWNAGRIGVDATLAAYAFGASLSFDFSNDPWITYVDCSTTPYTLKVLHWNGAAWDDWSPSPAIPCNAVVNPVRFDAGGTAYVAFAWADPAVPSGYSWPRVMRQTALTSWTNVGAAPLTDYCDSSDFSFRIAADDTPYIAMEETLDTGYTEVSVLKYDGASWVAVGRRGFTDGHAGQFPSLSFDSTGAPWVAYEEVGEDSVKSVQKYVGGEN